MTVCSFIQNGDNDPAKNSFDAYYMPLVEIKDYNELIDNKVFSDQKRNKKHMKNLLKCQETMPINRTFIGLLKS